MRNHCSLYWKFTVPIHIISWVWFIIKDTCNMEYLQHDYILTWTAYKPLISCLSCNKWSCGTYQNCWKELNALIRQRRYRESTYCESTDTERHMWDSINCTFCWVANTKIMIMFSLQIPQILSTIQVNNFHATMHTSYAFRWKSNRWEFSRKISDPLPCTSRLPLTVFCNSIHSHQREPR